MPRKKINPMIELKSEQNKRVTFNKRYNGLKIKLTELCIMCDIDFALIVKTKGKSKNEYIETYSSKNILKEMLDQNDNNTLIEYGIDNLIEKYVKPNEDKKKERQQKNKSATTDNTKKKTKRKLEETSIQTKDMKKKKKKEKNCNDNLMWSILNCN